MNRLDPNVIVELYRKHKVIPAFGKSLFGQGSKIKACAFGIAVIDKDPRFLQAGFVSPYRNADELIKLVGLDHSYANSFVHGFDGNDWETLRTRNRQGFQDGVATREAVLSSDLLNGEPAAQSAR